MSRKSGKRFGKHRKAKKKIKPAIYLNSLYQKGKFKELLASMQHVTLETEDHPLLFLKAQAFHKVDQIDDALKFIQRANRLAPDNLEYLRTTALWLGEHNFYLPALNVFMEIVKKNPDDLLSLQNMGLLLVKMERFEQAIVCFKKVIEADPKASLCMRHIGFCYYLLGDLDKAAYFYERTISLGGNTSNVWVLIGTLFLSKGESENAIAAFKKAIEIDDHCFLAYPNYVKAAKLSKDERAVLIEKLETLLQENSLLAIDKRLCHFSLGDLHHKQGNYGKALSHYELGNMYRKKIVGNFRVENLLSRLKWCRKYITKGFFSRERGPSSFSRRPVFVVGMPRSGTTLLEQIIASHEVGFGAGELSAIHTMFTDFGGGGILTDEVFKRMDSLGKEEIETLAQKYLQQLERHTKTAARVVDKMPQNQILLWLIALLFPEAPIIQCLRDARDTCLSCFVTDFNSGHTYKKDLFSVGQYYSIFQSFMNHWMEVLPNPILTVHYEDLIENPETMTRRVIDHIGLEWDPNCLKLRDRGHFSQTASNVQIREGIYKTSVQRWKKYENYLTPLLDGLEDGRKKAELSE